MGKSSSSETRRIERAKSEALTALFPGKVLGGVSSRLRVNSIKQAYEHSGDNFSSAINASLVGRARRAKKLRKLHSSQLEVLKSRRDLNLARPLFKFKK